MQPLEIPNQQRVVHRTKIDRIVQCALKRMGPALIVIIMQAENVFCDGPVPSNITIFWYRELVAID
jgi:hypothetical protein